MRLRELKRGTVISDALRVESPLDSHNGIATYLAEDSECGHVLLHLFPEFDENSLPKIENAVAFQRNVLHNVSRGGRYEEFLYFSEPFPLGEFLFEWLERRERVSVPEAIKRVLKILQILQQAHETGLYHGRITPKSILMERSSDAFALRLMGLGLSQSLTESMRLDIDWFDYTFDLEGMTPQAVDIYGIAIILMGLVSSESGIDSFEATGLLPPCLQGGILQQAMERALALGIDAYTDASRSVSISRPPFLNSTPNRERSTSATSSDTNPPSRAFPAFPKITGQFPKIPGYGVPSSTPLSKRNVRASCAPSRP